MSRAIVIFARAPEVEAAAKGLQIEQAAPLFRAVIASWLRAASAARATVVIACSAHARQRFAAIAPEVERIFLDQQGETFGQRIATASGEVCALGFDSILIAGIDAPPPADIERVFAALETHRADAVIAPARDGGVNLIALRAPCRDLLVTFSPRQRDLVDRCRNYFETLLLLPTASDIDGLDDLGRAREEQIWHEYRSLLDCCLVIARYAHPTHPVRRRGIVLALTSRPPPVAG